MRQNIERRLEKLEEKANQDLVVCGLEIEKDAVTGIERIYWKQGTRRTLVSTLRGVSLDDLRF